MVTVIAQGLQTWRWRWRPSTTGTPLGDHERGISPPRMVIFGKKGETEREKQVGEPWPQAGLLDSLSTKRPRPRWEAGAHSGAEPSRATVNAWRVTSYALILSTTFCLSTLFQEEAAWPSPVSRWPLKPEREKMNYID